MTQDTFRKIFLAIVIVVLVSLIVMLVVSIRLSPVRKFLEEPLAPTLCRSLPTGVVNWGIAMQTSPDGLYLCFQQGGAQGMTEVTCVPMERCK